MLIAGARQRCCDARWLWLCVLVTVWRSLERRWRKRQFESEGGSLLEGGFGGCGKARRYYCCPSERVWWVRCRREMRSLGSESFRALMVPRRVRCPCLLQWCGGLKSLVMESFAHGMGL